jgi:hypothetical protein
MLQIREKEDSLMKSRLHIQNVLRRRSNPVLRQLSLLALVGAGLLSTSAGVSVFAQKANEKTFASPGDAALAVYLAVKSHDTQALVAIFGSNANDIIHTGDDVADKKMGDDFIRRYDQMHRLVVEPDETVTLYIGAENWPMPISIVKNTNGTWYFDTEGGKQEILQRRVGVNENDAIVVLQTLVEAQQEYASEPRDGNKSKHYALKFVSDEGKHNGLYWKTDDNEQPSPIGPLIVSAASEGYGVQKGHATPFHGYYYHILTKEGATTKGGAHDYVVDGKLSRGFAFVAYPAEYRNSGVMTFIVNQSGVVYQKDLGDKTLEIAYAMQEYSPDGTWERVE